MADDTLLEVGRIEKAHGLKGEVVVGFVTNMTEARTAPGSVMFADPGGPRSGERMEVVRARPHKDKWLVVFAGHADRNAAEQLRGTVLMAEPIEDEDEVFVHELIDRRLIDQHGTDHGPVRSVIDNPAADLLELVDGRLVPLNFYVSHDDETVVVDVPDGLLDDSAEVVRDAGSESTG